MIIHNGNEWISVTTGIPSGGSYSYNYYETSQAECPPIGIWTSGGGSSRHVFCKADGVDQEDGCDPNPCAANANCVDLWDGFRCDCQTGFRANGLDHENGGHVCEAIPLVDECADETLNDCSAQGATCTDLAYDGYSCECYEGWTDLTPENPGTRFEQGNLNYFLSPFLPNGIHSHAPYLDKIFVILSI